MECTICNKVLKNQKSYKAHLKTKGHLNKVEALVEAGEIVNQDPVVVEIGKSGSSGEGGKGGAEGEVEGGVMIGGDINKLPVQENFNVKRVISESNLDMIESSVPLIIEKGIGKSIRYLYHISDIHIQLQKRHDIYRALFNKLYILLRKYADERGTESGLIVITGDILHNKDVISSDAIHLCQQFLNHLSEIMPVIIIAGNHDANLKQVSKMDSLTPTVFYIDGVHYLKDTGSYLYGDVCFVVQSVFDNDFVKSGAVDMSGISGISGDVKKVCLYHGMVEGCFAFNGEQYNKNMSLSLFDGFDAVLLGDIHKHQYLSKNVAYASSLIQQNFGEPVGGHGMIVWDLKEDSSKFVEIKNDYGFLKINMQKVASVEGGENGGDGGDGGEKGEDKIIVKGLINDLPEKIELKLYFQGCDEEERNEFVSELRKRCTIVSESHIDLHSHRCVDLDEEKGDKESLEDLEDVDQLSKAIEKYLKDEGKDAIVEKMVKINEELNVGLSMGSRMRFDKWYIKTIRFSNCFCYGDNNILDFSKIPFNIIFGIVGKNGMGKSSKLNIITHGLFGKGTVDRRDIVNKRCKNAYIEITLVGDDQLYRIRTDYRRDYSGSVKMRVNFYKIAKKEISENGSVGSVESCSDEDLSSGGGDGVGSGVSSSLGEELSLELGEGEKYVVEDIVRDEAVSGFSKIAEYIGGYDQFIVTNIIHQFLGGESICTATDAKLRTIFVSHLKFDLISKLNQLAKAKKTENKSVMDGLKKQIESIYSSYGGKLPKKSSKVVSETMINFIVENIEKEIATRDIKICECNGKLEGFETQKEKFLVELDELNKIIAGKEQFGEEAGNEDAVKDEIVSLEKEVIKYEKFVEKNENYLIEESQRRIDADTKIVELNEERDKIMMGLNGVENVEDELKNTEERMKQLNDMGVSSEIITDMKSKIDQDATVLESHQKEIEQLIGERGELKIEADGVLAEVMKEVEEEKKRLKQLDIEVVNHKSELLQLNQNLEEIDMDKLKEENKQLAAEKEEMLMNIVKCEEIEGAEEKIVQLEKKLVVIDQELGEVSEDDIKFKGVFELVKSRPKANTKCKRCVATIDWSKKLIVECRKLLSDDCDLLIKREGVEKELVKCREWIEYCVVMGKIDLCVKQMNVVEEKMVERYQMCDRVKVVEGLLDKWSIERELIVKKLEESEKKVEELMKEEKSVIRRGEIDLRIEECKKWITQYDQRKERYLELINSKWEIEEVEKKIVMLKREGELKKRYDECCVERESMINFMKSYDDRKYELELNRGELNELVGSLKQYEDILADILKNKGAEGRLAEVNMGLSELTPIIDEIKAKRLELIEERALYKSREEDINLKYSEYKKAKELMDDFAQYEFIMSDKGLPFYYMLNFAPYIEEECNHILSLLPYFNMKVKIGNEKGADKLSIDVIKDGIELSSKSLSGSESALVEVALRLAFIKYSQTAAADILLLDECFSSFDKSNLNNSSGLYDYIRDHVAQSLVITHQESVKGEFDKYTEIYKDDGFSFLNYP